VAALPVPSVAKSFAAGASFRAQYGIPDDALVVLFMSRVDYKKGLEFLLPALAAAKREQSRLWFVLAGSGEPHFLAAIRKLIRQNGIERWTTETGFISGAAKQGALSAASLFALPSLNENFGIVLVEAMSAGLPLLVSDQVYISNEVVAAGAGVRCKPVVWSCAEALCELVAAPERLCVMGQLAKALAAERFGVERATNKLLDIYTTALECRL
jgi:glycosyltransferase involved in cell wall biosynthesis